MRSIWRKPAIAILGGLMVVAGVIMLVTPGPGLLTIAGGLAVLATEYDWAKRTLHHVRKRIRRGERRRQASRR